MSPIKKIKKFINKNPRMLIRLKPTAKLVGYCPKYLSRLFKEEVGIGFSQYRLKIQMMAARKMLIKGSSVKKVARTFGYKNAESFTRCFKRLVGITPSKFAK